MRWFLFTLTFLLSVASSSLRADSESLCPYMILGSGSAEGTYVGNDCGDFCWSTIQLDNGDQFTFMCADDEAEKIFGSPGNRVAVDFEVEQFWEEISSHCMRPNVIKSGRIISEGSKQSTSGSKAEQADKELEKTRQAEESVRAQAQECPLKITRSICITPRRNIRHLLNFVSVVDSVSINEIIVNRGNCKTMQVVSSCQAITNYPGFPTELKYGQTHTLGSSCDNVLEVVVETNRGQWTFTFQ